NYKSQKGTEIAQNPAICALFFWSALERQIRIEGRVEKVSSTESDTYFASRPRGSQLGAWASHQSETLKDRVELEKRIEGLDILYPTVVPRPPHWGGYRIVPHLIEFWQGRSSRLHDRFVFEKNVEQDWKISRKNP